MATAEKRTLSIEARLKDLFSQPMGKIELGLRSFAQRAATAFKGVTSQIFSMRSAMTALAGGFVAFSGSQAITGIVQATDELDKLARGTGSTVQRLLTLKNAFSLQGVEADRFKTVLSALTKSISGALTDSSGKAAKSMDRLGLSIEDLKSNDPVQVLDRMSKALEQFATPQEKAAALLEVFPKMTSEISVLVDTLGQGQEAFRNLVATAEFFGGTMSEKGVAAVVRFDQALDVMRLSLERVGRSATVGSGSAGVVRALERAGAVVELHLDVGREPVLLAHGARQSGLERLDEHGAIHALLARDGVHQHQQFAIHALTLLNTLFQ